MMSSKLGEITKATNDSYLKLGYDYRYDDPKDPNRFFFRSDHFNYAVNGIPIVFWFDGVHEDYHQAGDDPEKIDYPKMEKITRTIFLTMWEIADLKERPAVDKQLPKELTPTQLICGEITKKMRFPHELPKPLFSFTQTVFI